MTTNNKKVYPTAEFWMSVAENSSPAYKSTIEYMLDTTTESGPLDALDTTEALDCQETVKVAQ